MKQNEIEILLPSVFQRTVHTGSPLDALLSVMEALHAHPEIVLENLDAYFDPYRCPDAFVPYLASWVDLERYLPNLLQNKATLNDVIFPSGLGRLRELILSAVFLSKWRGTTRGLKAFLEIATGVQGFAIDEQVFDANGTPLPFQVRVRAPAAAQLYDALIQRIIELEKPAYVTCKVQYEPGQETRDQPVHEEEEA